MRAALFMGVLALAGMLLCNTQVFAQQIKLNAQQPIGEGVGPDALLDIKLEAGNVLNQIKAGTDPNDRLLGIPQIIGRIMGQMMLVLGSLALIVFVYAGVHWMLAIGQGRGEAAAAAQKIIFWAVIGLIVIFTGYVIMTYVIKLLYSAAA